MTRAENGTSAAATAEAFATETQATAETPKRELCVCAFAPVVHRSLAAGVLRGHAASQRVLVEGERADAEPAVIRASVYVQQERQGETRAHFLVCCI